MTSSVHSSHSHLILCLMKSDIFPRPQSAIGSIDWCTWIQLHWKAAHSVQRWRAIWGSVQH